MEKTLTEPEEVLFRQIHPSLLQDGEPASSSFRPKGSDKGKLSVDRGAMTTAERSHALYTANGFSSVAVYGVTVGEFGKCGIPCEPDPLPATSELAANPAHALANFVDYGSSMQRTVAKRLKTFALARGVLHPKPEPDHGPSQITASPPHSPD